MTRIVIKPGTLSQLISVCSQRIEEVIVGVD